MLNELRVFNHDHETFILQYSKLYAGILTSAFHIFQIHPEILTIQKRP